MTAAAYEKDLLYQIARNRMKWRHQLLIYFVISQVLTLLALLSNHRPDSVMFILEVHRDVAGIQDDAKVVLQNQRSRNEDNMLRWLTPVDYQVQQHGFISDRRPGTS